MTCAIEIAFDERLRERIRGEFVKGAVRCRIWGRVGGWVPGPFEVDRITQPGRRLRIAYRVRRQRGRLNERLD